MKNQTKLACVLGAFMIIVCSCKKNENLKSNSEITSKGSKLSAGDGVWDLLGYGIDITRSTLDPNSKSSAPIIDLVRFKVDFPTTRTEVTSTSYGYSRNFSGATAVNYMRDFSNQSSFDVNADGSVQKTKVEGSTTGATSNYNYSGVFKKSSLDQTITKFSSRYSYASYDVTRVVKRLQFTHDAPIELLTQYLTPEFINNLNTMSADALVATYGTHVMLDISIGGVLRFNYSGQVENQTENSKKVETIKKGFSFGLLKLINVNLSSEDTQTELLEASKEIQNKVYHAEYFGGTNSGLTVSIDKDGNTAQTVNISNFESSINAGNAALVDLGKAVFIYNFITDPVKKAAVKTAVENYIASRQIIKELGEVPIYVYHHVGNSDHYFTPQNTAAIAPNFNKEGVAFFAFSTPAEGTVPIYVYYSVNGKDHYFTQVNQPTIANGAYKNEGIAFYAYPTMDVDRVPIFGYTGIYSADHYFTPENQPIIGNGGFRNEGIAFYGTK